MDPMNEQTPADENPETATPPEEGTEAVEATDAAPEAPEPPADPLAEQTARADALAERLKRVEAEFVNESKRLRKQTETERKFAIERVIVDMLPLVDSLHTAMKNLGDSEADQRMQEGLDLIGKQLLEILERHGVTPIEAEGQTFDPNRHEALFTIPRDDVEPQTVVEVLRPGFALHERVVRAVEVAVSVAPPQAAVPEADGDADGSDD